MYTGEKGNIYTYRSTAVTYVWVWLDKMAISFLPLNYTYLLPEVINLLKVLNYNFAS